MKTLIIVTFSISRTGRRMTMVKCERCGVDVYMPFKCNYCGGCFCSEHRLPEFHDCTGISRGQGSFNFGKDRAYSSYYNGFRRSPRRTYSRMFSFSDREVRDLAVSLLLILAIPLSWLSGYIFRNPLVVIGGLGIFAAAFLLHELAHKFSAQQLGYWAEYRLNFFGVIITFLSFFSPFKIVAPGAVVISGYLYSDDFGKISLAGPLTNIAQSIIYLLLSSTSQISLVELLANVGITVNSSLALFNLIPFGVFDGAKILRWDWKVWIAVVVAAGALFLYPAL